MYRLESEEGFSGGLITWGIFVLFLWLVGVPAVLCILLGAFAGAAVWLIIAFWRAEKSDEEPRSRDDDSPIRPVRRLIQRLPGSGGFGLGINAPQRITGDSSSGEAQPSDRDSVSRRKAIKQQPSSSLRDAIKRRKENSSNQL
jgi:hypothetical protein